MPYLSKWLSLYYKILWILSIHLKQVDGDSYAEAFKLDCSESERGLKEKNCLLRHLSRTAVYKA